jgi:hypothetical protein
LSKKYICAVGDSFVYGSELVREHAVYSKDFTHLPNIEITQLEFSTPTSELSCKYYEYLDSLRFTSLVAKGLGAGHFNYAQGGASQEGIKLQTHLLLNTLKEENIPLEDTIWLIGLTAKSRILFLDEPSPQTQSDYQWSKETKYSIFLGHQTQSYQFITEKLADELARCSTETDQNVKWYINIIDTVNLLKSNGISNYYLLNLFIGFAELHRNDLSPALALAKKLANDLTPNFIPSDIMSFSDRKAYVDLCKYGHPGIHSQEKIAMLILDRICNA